MHAYEVGLSCMCALQAWIGHATIDVVGISSVMASSSTSGEGARLLLELFCLLKSPPAASKRTEIIPAAFLVDLST